MQVNIELDEDGTVVLTFASSFREIAMSLIAVLEEMMEQHEAFAQAMCVEDATPEQHLQMLLLEALLGAVGECVEAVHLSVPRSWFGIFPREQVNETIRQYLQRVPSTVLMVGRSSAPEATP